ncbi:hypothetical protein [Sutterella sp.]|uniref:hypothetical protein n=1 Tax=Sutterella sp. TaxID=1981025 RepID=UPI003FD8DE0C
MSFNFIDRLGRILGFKDDCEDSPVATVTLPPPPTRIRDCKGKFYFFRIGLPIPSYLQIHYEADEILVCENRYIREAKTQARISAMNLGYNALLDYRIWTQTDLHWDNLRYRTGVWGRPALVLPRNYKYDVDVLINDCSDDFDNLYYGWMRSPNREQRREHKKRMAS